MQTEGALMNRHAVDTLLDAGRRPLATFPCLSRRRCRGRPDTVTRRVTVHARRRGAGGSAHELHSRCRGFALRLAKLPAAMTSLPREFRLDEGQASRVGSPANL